MILNSKPHRKMHLKYLLSTHGVHAYTLIEKEDGGGLVAIVPEGEVMLCIPGGQSRELLYKHSSGDMFIRYEDLKNREEIDTMENLLLEAWPIIGETMMAADEHRPTAHTKTALELRSLVMRIEEALAS